jgi:hypothetical protein
MKGNSANPIPTNLSNENGRIAYTVFRINGRYTENHIKRQRIANRQPAVYAEIRGLILRKGRRTRIPEFTCSVNYSLH